MITLQFVACNDPGSRLIEWFGGGARVSHVDAVLPSGYLLGARSDKVGDKPRGVQIRPPNYEKWSRVVRVNLIASPMMTDRFYELLKAEVGKPYDWRAILGFAIDRDWRDPHAWICSELIAAKLEECGWFPYRLAVTANKITPGAALLAVSAREMVPALAA